MNDDDSPSKNDSTKPVSRSTGKSTMTLESPFVVFNKQIKDNNLASNWLGNAFTFEVYLPCIRVHFFNISTFVTSFPPPRMFKCCLNEWSDSNPELWWKFKNPDKSSRTVIKAQKLTLTNLFFQRARVVFDLLRGEPGAIGHLIVDPASQRSRPVLAVKIIKLLHPFKTKIISN